MRAMAQLNIERSIIQHANGAKGKPGRRVAHSTHATSTFKRTPPRKTEYKMEYPSSCPWTLTHGRKCGQPHAPASCNTKQWNYDKVWPTIYAEKLCPICLCTGHISKECNLRARGPCNRTLSGGEKCAHYHHSKICPAPFISFRKSQESKGNQSTQAKQTTSNYSTATSGTTSSTGRRRQTAKGKKGGSKKGEANSSTK